MVSYLTPEHPRTKNAGTREAEGTQPGSMFGCGRGGGGEGARPCPQGKRAFFTHHMFAGA